MKVLSPINTLKLANIFHKPFKKIRFAEGVDTVEFSHTQKPFEELTLSTFKKLQKIKYNPSTLDGYYSTFVIDKLTGSPVTVFVKQTSNKSSGCENFDFYIKKTFSNKLELIGYRLLYVNDSKSALSPGYITSFQHDRYLGVGIREHQISVELMRRIGAPNIMINPTQAAEAFHESCGFEYDKQRAGRMILSEKALKEWDIFINSGQRIIK